MFGFFIVFIKFGCLVILLLFVLFKMGLGLTLNEKGGTNSLSFYCPKCGNRNVVVEYSEGGYYEFYRCGECGHIRSKKTD